ncbi:hypothetical protein PVAND_004933 [Polypedilum vanderplanki]|uniref:Uncharacterized protein n=1 Tax=Polypedilum vanderplanki TaxID=319348 RepID=A0A9J6BZ86_POLVA|nr:hypothetical protein PVAND_004933 [Polypedilum vanderplanki]
MIVLMANSDDDIKRNIFDFLTVFFFCSSIEMIALYVAMFCKMTTFPSLHCYAKRYALKPEIGNEKRSFYVTIGHFLLLATDWLLCSTSNICINMINCIWTLVLGAAIKQIS